MKGRSAERGVCGGGMLGGGRGGGNVLAPVYKLGISYTTIDRCRSYGEGKRVCTNDIPWNGCVHEGTGYINVCARTRPRSRPSEPRPQDRPSYDRLQSGSPRTTPVLAAPAHRPAPRAARARAMHGTAWRTAATGSARPPVVASAGRMRAAGRCLRPLLLPPSPPPPSPVVPPPPPPSRQWQLTLIPHPSPLVEVAARREMRHSTGRSDPDGPWSQPHLLFTKNSIRRFVRSARAIF